ncbi:Lrp/AsnC family transcriptional regulator [Prescottella sp. R16]|uniref:Lrp/AsnC family transcriptional regulator n=1 Tax=Prescottella sp. R16 TaxID=3064529 RepID=UPI00272ECD68|nr:Lrp/AsnC family transcriptional regulator [Prescottella sp. R16]
MDDLDRAILRELSVNGRISNADLADRVGLTPAPCLRRVRRLEADGVITGYRAVVDADAVGRGWEVLVNAEIVSQDRRTVEAFEAAVGAFDEVVEFRRMIGRPDYFIRVAVADLNAFEVFLRTKLMEQPAISKLESHLTMKKLKG